MKPTISFSSLRRTLACLAGAVVFFTTGAIFAGPLDEITEELAWLSEGIKQVTISTTMDTQSMPVWGVTGPDVPVTIIFLIRPGFPNGPSQFVSQGTIVEGKTLQDDSFGYQGGQILAFYINVGGTEFTWLNPASGRTPEAPNSPLSFALLSLDGAAGQAWFNRSLGTGLPSRMVFHVKHEGNLLVNIGSFYGDSSTIDFEDGLVIFDGSNFGYGTITPFTVSDFSGRVSALLTQARVASLQLTEARKKLKKAVKKAKKKDVKPKKFKPVKKAQKKVKRGALDFGNSLTLLDEINLVGPDWSDLNGLP